MGWSADQGGRRPPYWAHLSMVDVWAFVMLDFFSGGPFNPCCVRVAAFDWTASCSLAEKDMIALHFQLNPTLIEI